MMAAPQPEWLVKTNNLAVTYPNGHQALRPTSLSIRQGEFVVLLGPSGAGKSTLLRCLNGLVGSTAGDISISDVRGNLAQSTVLREHRRKTGMVFQQHHLIGRQTVMANVLMGRVATRRGVKSWLPWAKDDKLLALAAIERVDLLAKALTRADALSGGQQQRVGIARALIQQPRLMLADEPVASLDPVTAESVLTLLHKICKQDGLTAVVSLHQINFAKRFADRIVGLNQGGIVFEGTPSTLNDHDLQRLYAAAPPTKEVPPIGTIPSLIAA